MKREGTRGHDGHVVERSSPKQKLPLVYIAAPYTKPDPVENTHHAVKIGLQLWEKGICVPIIPHLTLFAHFMRPEPYEYWLAFDMDQLAHCDALLRLPGESAGADGEVAFAYDNGIPVFKSVASLVAWADGYGRPFADVFRTPGWAACKPGAYS